MDELKLKMKGSSKLCVPRQPLAPFSFLANENARELVYPCLEKKRN